MSRRNWIFTSWKEPTYDDDRVSYSLWKEETCPETGKAHWHGYLEMRTPAGMGGLKRILGDDTVHLEPRYGSQQQAIDYILKDLEDGHEPVEKGVRKAQGKRNDLLEIKETIDKGGSMMDVADEHFGDYVRYHRGLEKYKGMRDYKKIPNNRKIKVFVLWGPPGSGKTRTAMESSDDVYKLNEPEQRGTLWWCGYEGQETLLIDDFEGWINYNLLLTILDRYKLRLSTKGGHTWANWRTVYITSNLPVEKWYRERIDDCEALKRRFTEVTEVTGNTYQSLPKD